MPLVTLYTRVGCCLCDEAKLVLDAARRLVAFRLEVVDIDRDPELRRLYNDEVPVIAIGKAHSEDSWKAPFRFAHALGP